MDPDRLPPAELGERYVSGYTFAGANRTANNEAPFVELVLSPFLDVESEWIPGSDAMTPLEDPDRQVLRITTRGGLTMEVCGTVYRRADAEQRGMPYAELEPREGV